MVEQAPLARKLLLPPGGTASFGHGVVILCGFRSTNVHSISDDKVCIDQLNGEVEVGWLRRHWQAGSFMEPQHLAVPGATSAVSG